MRLLRKTGDEDGILGPGLLISMETANKTGKKEMKLQIPKQAQEIIEKLNRHGYEAYVVGGCVRDCLLGRIPGDWDITTSAKPEEVKAIFGRTIDTGIQHGTVTIMRGKTGYEVTTYRIDGEYQDGRHPKTVEFTSSLLEDLKRRDFTINAMAYSPAVGLVDAFAGIEDLEAGKIRCVGKAVDRFGEDALRMLRAIRFSAQLGFDIEEETWDAIRMIGPNLAHVSKERIFVELTKMVLSDHPDTIKLVFACGLDPYIADTFLSIRPETVLIPPSLPPVRYMRWAAFLRNQTPGEAEQLLKELKADNDTTAKVKTLVQWWRQPIGIGQAEIRRTMSQMTEELYDALVLLKKAVLESGRPESAVPETAAQLETICRHSEEIRRRGDCISLKTLAVTGKDLIQTGMKPGKGLGETLNYLLNLVLEDPERNEKELLIREAKKSV